MLEHYATAQASFVEIRRLAEAVCEVGRKLGMSEEQLFDMELAVVEAANNIVAHGARVPSDDYIALFMPAPAHQTGSLVVELRAQGEPVDVTIPEPGQMAPVHAEVGRGLMLIRNCVDEFAYERRGNLNVWRMQKKLA